MWKRPLRHTNLWLTDPWFYSSSFLQFISVDGHFTENAMMSVTPSARLWEWARRLGRNPSAFQPSTSANISRWCNIRCVSFSFQAASSCKWPVLGEEGYLEYLKGKLTQIIILGGAEMHVMYLFVFFQYLSDLVSAEYNHLIIG